MLPPRGLLVSDSSSLIVQSHGQKCHSFNLGTEERESRSCEPPSFCLVSTCPEVALIFTGQETEAQKLSVKGQTGATDSLRVLYHPYTVL